MNKTNRCTEFQFYWYYYSTYFGQAFCHHQEFLAVHRLWYILCSCDRLLPANGHNCIKYTKADVQLRTPDDGQKGCRKTCRVVIPIKLEFSASVGFIHKESSLLKIWPVGAELFRADGQTGRHDDANSCFSQFCGSAK